MLRVGYQIKQLIRPIESDQETISAIIKLFELGRRPGITIGRFRKQLLKVQQLSLPANSANLIEFGSQRSLLSWVAYHNQIKLVRYLIIRRGFNCEELLEDFTLPLTTYQEIIQLNEYDKSTKTHALYKALMGYFPEYFDCLIESEWYPINSVYARTPKISFWIFGEKSLMMLKCLPQERYYLEDASILIEYLYTYLNRDWSILNQSQRQTGIDCLVYLLGFCQFGYRIYIYSIINSLNYIISKSLILKLEEEIPDRLTFWKYFKNSAGLSNCIQHHITDMIESLYQKVVLKEWSGVEPILGRRFSKYLVDQIKFAWVGPNPWKNNQRHHNMIGQNIFADGDW